MRKKQEVKTYRQPLVNIVIVAVILALFLYLSIQLSRGFSVKVSTQRTQTVTDNTYISLTGYVFKSEKTVLGDSDGVVDYLVADGEKVGVDQVFADFYPMKGYSSSDISSKQKELSELSKIINRLDSKISGDGTESDLVRVNSILSKSYYAYIDSLLDGDYRTADRNGEQLLGALVDYSVITGKDDISDDLSESLKKQKTELIDSLGVGAEHIQSDIGCYFFYDVDGYESLFSSSKLEGLSADELERIVSSAPEKTSKKVIGKTVLDPKWYLAVPADEATCLKFKEGEIYTAVYPSGGGTNLNMKLEKIQLDGEDGEYSNGYLLFSNLDVSVASDFSRVQDVKILMDSCTGYRIPDDAVREEYGEKGVYVLVGTVVEFRRITVIGEGNGYYIVNTYENDLNEGTDNPIPYLKANDMIITSGTDLYDGKLLD